MKPAGGNGTSSSPYQIDSLDDLNLIEENQGAYYQLTSDIQIQGRINFYHLLFWWNAGRKRTYDLWIEKAFDSHESGENQESARSCRF